MIWIAHSVYLIVFIVFLFANALQEQTSEEFAILPSAKKEKIFKRPWTFIVLTICFLIMDCIVRTIKGGAFGKIFISDLIPTLLFIWMLLMRTRKGCKKEKLQWLPYVVFFLFTLIRNIIGHDRVIVIILMEIKSLVTLAAFAFVCLIVLADPDKLPTREEKAKADAEAKQREYEQRMREEQARIQAEKDARTHEAYERIVLGKKTSGSSYSSSGSYSSYDDKKERAVYGCSGCSYYNGNICTCSSSVQYNNYIMNPTGYVCGYYRR